jgi:hypothetical protein
MLSTGIPQIVAAKFRQAQKLYLWGFDPASRPNNRADLYRHLGRPGRGRSKLASPS